MPGKPHAKPEPLGSGRPPQSRTRLRKALKALPAAPCLGTRQGQPHCARRRDQARTAEKHRAANNTWRSL
eukprot:9083622-Alexandrium_andersonii.AAC.1